MKKLLLFSLAVLMATLAARADVVINATNFPDANFRAYLLEVYPSGTITTAQLAAHETMFLYNKNISSLQGIHYFTGLKELECANNTITSLDLSNNTALTHLNCSSNQLTELDVAGMSHLERLYVAENPQLEVLLCYSCNLKEIRLQDCTALYDVQCFDNPELDDITRIYTCKALRYFDGENCGFTEFNCWTMPTLTTLNLAESAPERAILRAETGAATMAFTCLKANSGREILGESFLVKVTHELHSAAVSARDVIDLDILLITLAFRTCNPLPHGGNRKRRRSRTRQNRTTCRRIRCRPGSAAK